MYDIRLLRGDELRHLTKAFATRFSVDAGQTGQMAGAGMPKGFSLPAGLSGLMKKK